jgi:Holliday junction resolvase RusA-like endonuclease
MKTNNSNSMNDVQVISFEIKGEPASKANSRKLVTIHGRPAFIKSTKARGYAEVFKLQCPKLRELLDGDLVVIMTICYASRRPDLDESLILDLMQGLIYTNDRQVKERHTHWGLDKMNPRTLITIVKPHQKAQVASLIMDGHLPLTQ